MIVSQGVGAIPTVGQLSHALRDNYRITLVGPDGKSGAIRLGADRGVNLFSSSGITRRLRNLRRTSPSAVAFVSRSRPSKPTGDWFWYLIKIITSTIPAFVKILFERPPCTHSLCRCLVPSHNAYCGSALGKTLCICDDRDLSGAGQHSERSEEKNYEMG